MVQPNSPIVQQPLEMIQELVEKSRISENSFEDDDMLVCQPDQHNLEHQYVTA